MAVDLKPSLSMRRNHEQRVRDQTSDHDNNSVDRQGKTKPPQQFSPPRPALQPTSAKKALVLAARTIVFVVFLDELLVMWRLRRGHLVVEQAGKDEADACASCTAHVRKHLLE